MIAVDEELFVAGIARATHDFFATHADGLLGRVAELQAEILTTAEAAALLKVSPKTLRERHVEWGLSKSVALGEDNPRYYRSQILARLKAKEIKGRAG